MTAPTMPSPSEHPQHALIERDTRAWLERAVIGLNLCPFAKAVHVKGQIHFVVSTADDGRELLDDLARELQALDAIDPAVRSTTLLIAPDCLADFLAFNDLLGRADKLLRRLKLVGTLQVASFHPRYQFAGTDPDDIGNFTNRAPYPTLHLLRESSIDQAVRSFPQAEQIFEQNIRTLERLGPEGWAGLDVGPSIDETPPR